MYRPLNLSIRQRLPIGLRLYISLRLSIGLAVSLSLLACSQQGSESETPDPKAKEAETLNLHVPSPDWRDQIIYFLMTDRFNDGDPGNNDQGAGEYDPGKSSHFSGGDIKGVIEQLDYIEELGATSVWMTPVVENQWWSSANNYGGYHGYWATHFGRVDPHLGDLLTYQELSHKLHDRGMYLIKDIVVNHTGNFFNYRGGQAGYNPEDTAENFYFLEQPDSIQPRPVQPPFDMIDRNNPDHVAAAIYNWTPTITDYRDKQGQFRNQLGMLADVNTTNPRVIDAFKGIYGDWIRKAGVDAFRIDTVRYVEHEFFHHFIHDDDGIQATSKATGREDFLIFGEVLETSEPYQNDGEKSIASYLGKPQQPELNSVISFPLYRELHAVFGQGAPTSHLAYRIEQHMTQYPDPWMMPIFIDNHDLPRFLSNGNQAGLQQALATIFTMPGIPTIYQGTEQAMLETRQAMFEGGYNAEKDLFDTQSDMFQFVKRLTQLRRSHKLFSRGDLKSIVSEKGGAGVLAYTRSYQGRTVLVMFNTSNNRILLDSIPVANEAKTLQPLFINDETIVLDASWTLNNQGQLTNELPARAIVVAELLSATAPQNTRQQLTMTTKPASAPYSDNVLLEGTSDFPNQTLLLVKNGNLDLAAQVSTGPNGNWRYEYPVINLGSETISIKAYHQDSATVSQAVSFSTSLDKAQLTMSAADPVNDDRGPDGNTLPPQHVQSIGQMDIVNSKVEVGGDVLRLTLNMRELTDDWLPTKGFDNVAFSLFFATHKQQGLTQLPLLNASMPQGLGWNMAHVVFGWGNSTFGVNGASAKAQGEKYGVAPDIEVRKAEKQIQFTYNANDFGIGSWQNATVYITTWDITGEGMYRKLAAKPGDWDFSGPEPLSRPKILDSALLTIKAK